MRNYIVKERILHNDKTYEIGSSIVLDQAEHDEYLSLGVIEEGEGSELSKEQMVDEFLGKEADGKTLAPVPGTSTFDLGKIIQTLEKEKIEGTVANEELELKVMELEDENKKLKEDIVVLDQAAVDLTTDNEKLKALVQTFSPGENSGKIVLDTEADKIKNTDAGNTEGVGSEASAVKVTNDLAGNKD